MTVSDMQLNANRSNAGLSTGPTTGAGKQRVSTNALAHCLRSSRIVLEDEDPAEFADLLEELSETLRPVGPIETELTERIAFCMWRQRRLVRAETAALSLHRRPSEIAKAIDRCYEPSLPSDIREEHLAPFCPNQISWCKSVVAEIEALGAITLDTLETDAPLVHRQLLSDAEEDQESPEDYAAQFDDGLTGFVSDLYEWCQKQLKEAEQRPKVMALAEQMRHRRLVLPQDQLELFARYQTTLNNQLYKALKAFREAQDWRLKTMEAIAETVPSAVAAD